MDPEVHEKAASQRRSVAASRRGVFSFLFTTPVFFVARFLHPKLFPPWQAVPAFNGWGVQRIDEKIKPASVLERAVRHHSESIIFHCYWLAPFTKYAVEGKA
jgi:hypothetical protein